MQTDSNTEAPTPTTRDFATDPRGGDLIEGAGDDGITRRWLVHFVENGIVYGNRLNADGTSWMAGGSQLTIAQYSTACRRQNARLVGGDSRDPILDGARSFNADEVGK